MSEKAPHNLTTSAGDFSFPGGCADPRGVTAETWEELNHIENRRRDILQRVELPFWRILMFVDGTCLKAMAMEFMIWIPIAIYIAIRWQARTSEQAPENLKSLGDTDIAILGAPCGNCKISRIVWDTFLLIC